MILNIEIAGWLMVALALIHISFPKYFHWKQDLSGMSLINKQIFQVHTLFIALTVLFMGLLCISSAEELVNTKLGHRVVLGLMVFWGLRMLIQFFGYSKNIWKGKRFETVAHILFSMLWLYYTIVFFMAYKYGS